MLLSEGSHSYLIRLSDDLWFHEPLDTVLVETQAGVVPTSVQILQGD